jgi:hypothetical protein
MNNNYNKGPIYHLFDSNNYYILKRGKKWNIYHVLWWFYMPISYIISSIMFAGISIISLEDAWNDAPPIWFFVIFILAFLFLWIQWLIENIKLRKVKNFKRNWGWIVKKLKVSDISTCRISRGKGGSIDVYYIEIKDWDNIYYSNAYKRWEINWTSVKELKELYESYWFHYDENQTQKKEILQEIDRLIAETQYEIDNWGFLGNISRKRKLAATKEDRVKIEYWYISPYWQVEWNRISVWDMVDVYINPDKPDNYWVDIDFLFDK